MSIKNWLAISLLMIFIFAICCYLIVFHSKIISNSSIATNLVLALAAISACSWPVCLARAFQTYMKDKSK